MSILFSEIYQKAIALFDDPKVTIAYKTNSIQFQKLMYTFLQNAIFQFTNPAVVSMRLSNYEKPAGFIGEYENNSDRILTGDQLENAISEIVSEIEDAREAEETEAYLRGGTVIQLESEFLTLDQSNAIFSCQNRGLATEGKFFLAQNIVAFKEHILSEDVFSFEQYFCGKFNDDFSGLNQKTSQGDAAIVGQIEDILARLLVKAWAEGERNVLLDIRNIMQDSDFKLSSNDRMIKAKDSWIDQLDTETLQLQNKLSWNIRFFSGSRMIGRG